MKLVIVFFLLAAPALAQKQPATVASACGPKDVIFDVKPDGSLHAFAQPGAGKALVYIIQERGIICPPRECITKLGLDGAWVGALKTNSYYFASVEPGEHHVCANIQAGGGLGELRGFAHFTAEAGKVYYFRTYADRFDNFPAILDIGPIDSDEARYLIATSPLSVSQPRK
jgi:hypothetical protein